MNVDFLFFHRLDAVVARVRFQVRGKVCLLEDNNGLNGRGYISDIASSGNTKLSNTSSKDIIIEFVSTGLNEKISIFDASPIVHNLSSCTIALNDLISLPSECIINSGSSSSFSQSHIPLNTPVIQRSGLNPNAAHFIYPERREIGLNVLFKQ